MSEFVTGQIKELGVAGAIISVLLTTVIPALVTAVIVLWKQNNGMNKARIAERDVFAKLFEANTTALNKNAEATIQRNAVTEKLADAIETFAVDFRMTNERVNLYHTDNKEKLKEVVSTVGSMADAVRVNTGMVTDVRNGNLQILHALDRRRS